MTEPDFTNPEWKRREKYDPTKMLVKKMNENGDPYCPECGVLMFIRKSPERGFNTWECPTDPETCKLIEGELYRDPLHLVRLEDIHWEAEALPKEKLKELSKHVE